MTEYTLITGATSGIGRSFAWRMAQRGESLLLVSRDSGKLTKIRDEITSQHDVDVRILEADLSNPAAGQGVYEAAVEMGIHVGTLINNAGFNECGPFLETDLGKESAMIGLHAGSTTVLTKHFIPAMVKKGRGRVLNIASTGSFVPCPNNAVYAATKAYVLQFSKALHTELSGTGVTVTAVCPGATRSEFARKAGIEGTMLFKWFVLSPEQVVQEALKAVEREKASVVVGLYNKIVVGSARWTPEWIFSRVAMKLLERPS